MTKEIEIGDFVTIIGGDMDGWSGILDNVFTRDGVLTFAVVDESYPENFHYATAIKPLKPTRPKRA